MAQQQVRTGLAVSIQGLKNYFEAEEIQVKIALVENSKVLRDEMSKPCSMATVPEGAMEVLSQKQSHESYLLSDEEMENVI